jgi:hypothetical protein
MMSGFRSHRKQGVRADALLERQRDVQQHVPRRKLKEECSWDQSATAVLGCVQIEAKCSKQCDILRRQLANSKCDCEQAPPSGKSMKLVKEGRYVQGVNHDGPCKVATMRSTFGVVR